MGRLYKRKVHIAIGQEVGKEETIIMPDTLHVIFDVTKTVTSQPNALRVMIFNLNRKSRQKIEAPLNIITVRAGYEDDLKGGKPENLPIVSRADVTFVRHRRFGGDFITEIEAGEGAVGYWASFMYDGKKPEIIGYRVPPGSKITDVFDILKTMFSDSQIGIAKTPIDRGFGVNPDFDDVVKAAVINATGSFGGETSKVYSPYFKNGKTWVGLAHEVMDRLAARHRLHWYLENNILTIVPLEAFIKSGDSKTFTPQNGLRGLPSKLDDRSTEIILNLNPAVVPWSPVSIKMNLEENQALNGTYKANKVVQRGDTDSSGDWDTIVEGIAP